LPKLDFKTGAKYTALMGAQRTMRTPLEMLHVASIY